ncbi:MAG: PDZ domain-containing protein [Candidatus Brocadiales bacterium]
MHTTGCRRRTSTLFCIVFALVWGIATPVEGASLFSGLILSKGERGGVKVVEVYPDSPSDRAGVKVSDQIVELNGQKIGVLEDFVRISRGVDKKVPEVSVKVMRNGDMHDFVISSYSIPVYGLWKVKVVEPPYSALGVASLLQYWTEKGKRGLAEGRGNIPVERKIADYREAVKYFFFALHYSPSSVGTALLVADTYKKMAELYLAEGRLPEALQSFAAAADFYNKAGEKATKEKDLQRILTGLQEVEERLFMLLPQEEGLNPAAQGSGGTGR